MNIIACGENCRWQQDGCCTLDDLTHLTDSSADCVCRYFEKN